MKKLELSYSEVNFYLANLKVLRAFPQVVFTVNKNIQKNIIALENVLKDLGDQTTLLREKAKVITEDKEKSEDDKKSLYEDINKEFLLIQTNKYEVEIIPILQSEFPLDKKDWGNKETLLENKEILKENYLEAFLILLDTVFVEA